MKTLHYVSTAPMECRQQSITDCVLRVTGTESGVLTVAVARGGVPETHFNAAELHWLGQQLLEVTKLLEGA